MFDDRSGRFGSGRSCMGRCLSLRLCAIRCDGFRTIGARGGSGFLPFFEDDLARDTAWRAHDAAAWMRRGTAHVEIVDWSAVIGPAGDGAKEEKLFEGEFALEDVALCESEFSLEVERCEHL